MTFEPKKDPVCGMDVDPKTAAGKSEYQGQMYYFCSAGCKKAFDKEPAKYAGQAQPHAGHHLHAAQIQVQTPVPGDEPRGHLECLAVSGRAGEIPHAGIAMLAPGHQPVQRDPLGRTGIRWELQLPRPRELNRRWQSARLDLPAAAIGARHRVGPWLRNLHLDGLALPPHHLDPSAADSHRAQVLLAKVNDRLSVPLQGRDPVPLDGFTGTEHHKYRAAGVEPDGQSHAALRVAIHSRLHDPPVLRPPQLGAPALNAARSDDSDWSAGGSRMVFVIGILLPEFTRPFGSPLDEAEQVFVHPVLQRGAHAVRGALVDLEDRILDQLRGQQGRGADGDDLVVVPMQDQRRHVERLEILGEIGF